MDQPATIYAVVSSFSYPWSKSVEQRVEALSLSLQEAWRLVDEFTESGAKHGKVYVTENPLGALGITVLGPNNTIRRAPEHGGRAVIAIVGSVGVGKSTWIDAVRRLMKSDWHCAFDIRTTGPIFKCTLREAYGGAIAKSGVDRRIADADGVVVAFHPDDAADVEGARYWVSHVQSRRPGTPVVLIETSAHLRPPNDVCPDSWPPPVVSVSVFKSYGQRELVPLQIIARALLRCPDLEFV